MQMLRVRILKLTMFHESTLFLSLITNLNTYTNTGIDGLLSSSTAQNNFSGARYNV